MIESPFYFNVLFQKIYKIRIQNPYASGFIISKMQGTLSAGSALVKKNIAFENNDFALNFLTCSGIILYFR